MKDISSSWFLAAAFALPPKVVDRSWHFEERQKMYSSVKKLDNAKIEVLDTEPNPSGLMRLDRKRDELSWFSAAATHVNHLNLRTHAKNQKTIKLDDRALASFAKISLTKASVKRGTWELLSKALYFVPLRGDGRPLWSLPIADDLVGVEVDKDRSTWMGLSTYPSKLYHMFWMPSGRRDEALLEVLRWDEHSELVAWVPCAEGRSLLLENKGDKAILHGLRQNSKLRTLDWESYAELNVTSATNMLSRTCSEVYVSGMSGLTRVLLARP